MNDPLDTSTCPLGVRCEICGAEAGVHGRLSVQPVDMPYGVFCLTVDEHCGGGLRKDRTSLTLMAATIERLIKQHLEHLGRSG